MNDLIIEILIKRGDNVILMRKMGNATEDLAIKLSPEHSVKAGDYYLTGFMYQPVLRRVPTDTPPPPPQAAPDTPDAASGRGLG